MTENRFNGKRLVIFAGIILLLIANMVFPAFASEADSEGSLRALLTNATGEEQLDYFWYGDYDGDGSCEAFAFIGEERSDGMIGDIWFVSPAVTTSVQTGKSYLAMEKQGEAASMLFFAEEWYGGSGSVAHMWVVEDGRPVKINVDINGGLSYGGNNEFHAYPSAFDLSTDGTGHTWKRYYYYLDGKTFREYGGIYINESDLLKFDGAQEILQRATGEGYSVRNIIYRGNGIININLVKGSTNANMTLRYDESSVTDLEVDFGGVYDLANTPSMAVYPAAFVEPVSQKTQNVQAADTAESAQTTNAANNQAIFVFTEIVQEPEGLSKEQIRADLGVFDFSELINIDGVEATQSGAYQNFKVNFQEDVYHGGTDGYGAEWLTTQGIIAEKDMDLDGDSVDEYVVVYMNNSRDAWDYLVHECRIAIYEPSGSGYVLAADFDTNFSMTGTSSERFMRIVNGEGGMRIMCGYIGYWDGGCAGIIAVFYGYDGSEVYVDTIVSVGTDPESYVLCERIPVADVTEIMNLCGDYEYEAAALAQKGIIGGYNFHYINAYDASWDWNYFGEERFAGIDLGAQYVAAQGLYMGYVLYTEDGYTSYDLYLDGGESLVWAKEGFEDWEHAYIQLQFLSDLTYSMPISFVQTPTGSASDAAATAPVSDAASTGSVNAAAPAGSVSEQTSAPTVEVPASNSTVPVEVNAAPSIAQYSGSYGVQASSYFYSAGSSISVSGDCAVDRSLNTAWNTDGRISGEWIQFSVQYGQSYEIGGFRIANGYWKDSSVYSKNSRARTLDVYCDGQYVQTFQLTDSKDYQTFVFDQPVEASSIRFQIVDGYSGSKYQDCAITEIELLGPNCNVLSEATLGDWGRSVMDAHYRILGGNTIQKGDNGTYVVGLQLILRHHGVLSGTVDGDFGGGTRSAVEAFQSKAGLPVTGVVDYATWDALNGDAQAGIENDVAYE